MKITMELFELKTLCASMAELGAAKLAARLKPQSDCLSQREAYSLYGEACVKSWVSQSLISPERKGSGRNSKLRYSRAELLALSQAESLSAIINKTTSL